MLTFNMAARYEFRYQFHMNPYIVKCMCANFDAPVVNTF